MRRYALASPEHKRDVDLRDYEDVIVEAVMTAMKDVDDVSVVVHEHYYEVSPSPGRGAAIAIGVVDVDTVAIFDRPITGAQNVTIRATSKNVVDVTAHAGANGAEAGGEADGASPAAEGEEQEGDDGDQSPAPLGTEHKNGRKQLIVFIAELQYFLFG